MNDNDRKCPAGVPPRRVGLVIESVVGCKWSLSIMDLIRRGTTRPGAIERSIEGLSAKVLGDCLKRLVEFGLLRKDSFAEVPPRVEYSFTQFGGRFLSALEELNTIEAEINTEFKRIRRQRNIETG